MTACLENEIEFHFWNHIYKEILYALVTFDRMEYFLIIQNMITQIGKKYIILYTLNSNQKGFFWILFKFWIESFDFFIYIGVWIIFNKQFSIIFNRISEKCAYN